MSERLATPGLYCPRIRLLKAAPGIRLTYALRSDPAPLTVSVSTTDATEASIELVITNDTTASLAVAEIDITIDVGSGGTDLVTQTTANSAMTISAIAGFTPQQPGAVTQGQATFSAIATTTPVPLAPGASFVIELYGLPVNTVAGSTTITVAESIGSVSPAPPTVTFQVTKFPYGFFLNGLMVTVPSGSNFVSAAQVNRGTPVTLQWDGSQPTASSYAIVYSTNGGQVAVTPASANSWTSPQLVSDTIFTLTMTAPTSQGGTVSQTLSAGVSVATPDLVANDVTANATLLAKSNATIAGTLTVTGITAANGGLNVNGATQLAGLTTSGGATVGGAATLNQGLTVNGGALTASGGAAIGGTLTLPGIGQMFGQPVQVPPPVSGQANYHATSDGFLVVNIYSNGASSYTPFEVTVYTGLGPEFYGVARTYVDRNGQQAIGLPPMTIPIAANSYVAMTILPALPPDYLSYTWFFPIGAGTMTPY
jgi:hypothetical protein